MNRGAHRRVLDGHDAPLYGAQVGQDAGDVEKNGQRKLRDHFRLPFRFRLSTPLIVPAFLLA
jgi:hypothetical protein